MKLSKIISILLLVSVAVFAKYDKPIARIRQVIDYRNVEHGVSVVEVDSCEYLLVVLNYNIGLLHKENCRNQIHKSIPRNGYTKNN
jgi:hypothetical protein